MRGLRTYVVRVYRRHAEEVIGTVQEVPAGRSTAFRSMQELWRAVGSPPRRLGSIEPLRHDPSEDGTT